MHQCFFGACGLKQIILTNGNILTVACLKKSGVEVTKQTSSHLYCRLETEALLVIRPQTPSNLKQHMSDKSL